MVLHLGLLWDHSIAQPERQRPFMATEFFTTEEPTTNTWPKTTSPYGTIRSSTADERRDSQQEVTELTNVPVLENCNGESTR